VNILFSKRKSTAQKRSRAKLDSSTTRRFFKSNSIGKRYSEGHMTENPTNHYNPTRNGESGCHDPPQGFGNPDDPNKHDDSSDKLRSRIQIMGSISKTETNREFFTDACLPARVEPPIKPIVTIRGNTLFKLIHSC
jgi:hypothetical protein